ncbi:MAG: glutathione S-transferase family protein [Gammaproteobacteria bacterium]|nr:glutathione S-transferase family protein [Gammaproteobacteria bacterium]
MIKIYHVPRTRSVRVIWLCEELGVPYELIPVDFSAEYRASAEWRKLNPVGKVPVMIDTAPASGPVTMFESGAMVEYVLDHYGDGRLRPAPRTAEHAMYLQWTWFAEATFARPLGEIVNHRREFPGDAEIPAVVEEMKNRARLCLDALEQALVDREYLLGADFSAADVMMGYTLLICEMFRLLGDDHPRVSDYFARLSARPGYQTAAGGGS